MTITTKRFEVAVDNERAALAFDLRGHMVDFIRSRIKDALARAEDAEIDRNTALRRFSLTWAATAKGYRLPRAVPASLVNWAGFVEAHAVREDYPAALAGYIGTFDKDCVSALPGNVLLVKMGGVTFAGSLDGGKPADLFEVRVGKVLGKYEAVLVCGRFEGDRSDMPVPTEPEMQDA